MYILASLAEIEVQIQLGQKIKEIINETLFGKVADTGNNKFSMEATSRKQEKSSSPMKKMTQNGSKKRKTTPLSRGTVHKLDGVKNQADIQKNLRSKGQKVAVGPST